MNYSLKKFLMDTLGCSERTLLRRMQAGLIGGAYPTKGKQWRIKKPARATEVDLRRLYKAGWDKRLGKWVFPSSCEGFPPALVKWLERIVENEAQLREKHPFRRIHRRRMAARKARDEAHAEGYYTLDDYGV
jgi:hypothetical protein